LFYVNLEILFNWIILNYNHLNIYKCILLFVFNNCTVLSFEPILEELKWISIIYLVLTNLLFVLNNLKNKKIKDEIKIHYNIIQLYRYLDKFYSLKTKIINNYTHLDHISCNASNQMSFECQDFATQFQSLNES